jgi:hypothetical protein
LEDKLNDYFLGGLDDMAAVNENNKNNCFIIKTRLNGHSRRTVLKNGFETND